MLKNKIIVRKIRNILILLMALIIMFGAYRNIRDSRAEDVIEIGAVAVDNYALLNNEEFILEATEVSEDLFEIEMPTSINGKVVNKIISVTLEDFPTEEATLTPEDTTGETTTVDEASTDAETTPVEEATTTPTEEKETVEVVDNKIQLTGEQLDTKQIVIEAEYQSALLTIDETGMYFKDLLYEKTEEERSAMEMTEDTRLLYNKVLTYEDEENGRFIQIEAYFPKDARLEVQEAQQEQLTPIFGELQLDIAYDIKILTDVVTEVPIDEENPDSEVEQIIETVEIDTLNYGETMKVSITDTRIKTESIVYFVTHDDTYDRTAINENTEGSINFDAYYSTIYAVKSEQSISTENTTGDSTEDGTGEIGEDGDLDIGGGLEDETVGASLSTYKHLFNPWARNVCTKYWLFRFYDYISLYARG